MDIAKAVWNIFITPLELVFEVIFNLALKVTHSELIAIVFLSIVVSTLVLPLYMRAEKIETEERNKEKELSHWVTHIKKHFKGDERYMILNAYYRENQYSPLYQLRSSISILLQIPFFMAAYHFLGERALDIFELKDFFAKPDGFLSIGSININVLPIVMTLINLVATYIYTKGLPVKAIIRSLVLPLLFLVLLYNSPCALLIYWTMNNIYSLVKILIIKFSIEQKQSKNISKEVLSASDKHKERKGSILNQDTKTMLFVLPMMFMAILTGFLIPLAYFSASPEEFINVNNPQTPLAYLGSSAFVSIGFFILWPSVFFFLANKKIKNLMTFIAISGAVFSAFNYLFGADTGTINTVMVFDQTPSFAVSQKIINLLVFGIIVLASAFLIRFKRVISIFFIAVILTTVSISALNAKKIHDSYKSIVEHIDDFREEEAPKITLSSNSSNVMVIMIDKAESGFIPYIFHEFPEIKEQFDGFTYYPNCMSFGMNTLKTSSALFGGYEYTPERMDARKNESLKDKHDESLKVLPKLFSDHGYHATLMDLPYPGWTWTGDYSSFKDIDNCDSFHAVDYYSNNTELNYNTESRRNRNLFMYSIFRCVPMCIQELIYDNGDYLLIKQDAFDVKDILPPYKVLENLGNMTRIDNSYNGCLVLFDNETVHDQANLIDFDPYKSYPPKDFREGYYISDGNKEKYLGTWFQAAAYESTAATMKKLGDYFDYLRELGIYDNTRIIIVSDHGSLLGLFDELISDKVDAEIFNCMLMTKDFDSTGSAIDYTFMTNADVPTFAVKGIISNPINPYTGKPINSDMKYEGIYVDYNLTFEGEVWNPDLNNGNTFFNGDCQWFKLVNQDIFDKKNWIRVEKRGQ